MPSGPFSARKSQTTTRPFRLIFEIRVGPPILEIEARKRDAFDAHPAPSSALHAVVVIPMTAKERFIPYAVHSLRLSTDDDAVIDRKKSGLPARGCSTNNS